MNVNLRMLRCVFMLIKMLFLVHIEACMWYGLSVQSERDNGKDTWRGTYSDGELTRQDAPNDKRYLFSIYWSVTTMTTIGYGDLIPTNDKEVLFVVTAMLISALIFGFLLSNMGSLLASVDRQVAAVEAANDSMKEYVAWRGLPKALAVRVKKHHALYFEKGSAFDEVDLIAGLSPTLRSEVTCFVLKSTLGKLPLFTGALDTEFQMEVFPYIQPVTYMKDEVIFRKGDVSRELMFLLEGQVSILGVVENEVDSILTKDREIMMSPDGIELLTMKHGGAFGESVVIGMRRPRTHVANTFVEALLLTKDSLMTILEQNQRDGVRIVRKLMEAAARKQRVIAIRMRFVITAMPQDWELRAALVVQLYWTRHLTRVCAKTAPTSKLDSDPPHIAKGIAKRRELCGTMLDALQAEALSILDELREESRTGALEQGRPMQATRKGPRGPARESSLVDNMIEQGRAARQAAGKASPMAAGPTDFRELG